MNKYEQLWKDVLLASLSTKTGTGATELSFGAANKALRDFKRFEQTQQFCSQNDTDAYVARQVQKIKDAISTGICPECHSELTGESCGICEWNYPEGIALREAETCC